MNISETAIKPLITTSEERILETSEDALLIQKIQAGEVAFFDKLVK